jgi:membrane associated rhomboid family serine protease
MGIYDRDYYRREGYSFLGSFTESGRICRWLIGINIGCFIAQLVGNSMFPGREDPVTHYFKLNTGPESIDVIWRLVTYAFLHDTVRLTHILFNMLFLYWFGRDMEDRYGPREFLAFYLVSAVVGGIAFVLTPLVGLGESGSVVGASGAVTAVMVLYALHYPRKVIYLFLFLPIPIWFFVLFNVAQDGFALLSRNAGNVAVSCHLGGAAFAYAYYKLQWNITNLLPNVKAWRKRRSQPRLRVYREMEEDRPAPVGVTAASPPPTQGRPDDDILEAKLDAVLEKISRVGKENLTDSDREVLRLAGEAIKRRRS